LAGLGEFGVHSIYNLDIFRLKRIVEELDRPLHRIENLRRRPNLWDLNKVAVPLAGCNPVEAQITAVGATWLDRQLVSRERVSLSEAGFGHEVRQALQARIDHLVAEGLGRRQGQGVTFTRQLIETLRRRELNTIAADIKDRARVLPCGGR
jgi:Protein of unknown function (DUF3363)